jgi:hypothetical protein
MLCYVMLCYGTIFIYLQQLGIRAVEVVGKLVKNRKLVAIYKRRNNTQKIQNHGIHKIENKRSKQEHQHKKNLKKCNRLFRK